MSDPRQDGGPQAPVGLASDDDPKQLAAKLVHSLYRLVKACQLHGEANTAVAHVIDQVQLAAVAFCERTKSKSAAILFTPHAVFVNRSMLKTSKETYQLALEFGRALEACEVTEITLSLDVSRQDIAEFGRVTAEVLRDGRRSLRFQEGGWDGVKLRKVIGHGTSAAIPPHVRAARTYAAALLIVRGFYEDIREGKYELRQGIKRVAQKIVAQSDVGARLLLSIAAAPPVDSDRESIALATAIVAHAMATQLTSDRPLLTALVGATLMADVGRQRLVGYEMGASRRLSPEEEAQVPMSSIVALTALGRLHPPNIIRAVIAYESLALRQGQPLYGGRRSPLLLSRIAATARAFTELRIPAPGMSPISIDDALQVMESQATDNLGRTLIKLLTGALGIFPAGSMVELSTGEMGVVLSTPSHPVDFARPLVRILYDAQAQLLGEPIDVDLSEKNSGRLIKRPIDASDQQMKQMRAYVMQIAANRARRKSAHQMRATAPHGGAAGSASGSSSGGSMGSSSGGGSLGSSSASSSFPGSTDGASFDGASSNSSETDSQESGSRRHPNTPSPQSDGGVAPEASGPRVIPKARTTQAGTGRVTPGYTEPIVMPLEPNGPVMVNRRTRAGAGSFPPVPSALAAEPTPVVNQPLSPEPPQAVPQRRVMTRSRTERWDPSRDGAPPKIAASVGPATVIGVRVPSSEVQVPTGGETRSVTWGEYGKELASAAKAAAEAPVEVAPKPSTEALLSAYLADEEERPSQNSENNPRGFGLRWTQPGRSFDTPSSGDVGQSAGGGSFDRDSSNSGAREPSNAGVSDSGREVWGRDSSPSGRRGEPNSSPDFWKPKGVDDPPPFDPVLGRKNPQTTRPTAPAIPAQTGVPLPAPRAASTAPSAGDLRPTPPMPTAPRVPTAAPLGLIPPPGLVPPPGRSGPVAPRGTRSVPPGAPRTDASKTGAPKTGAPTHGAPPTPAAPEASRPARSVAPEAPKTPEPSAVSSRSSVTAREPASSSPRPPEVARRDERESMTPKPDPVHKRSKAGSSAWGKPKK